MKTKAGKTSNNDIDSDRKLSKEVKAFLKAINSRSEKRIKHRTTEDLRVAFTQLQASVKTNLSGIDETEKVISTDGHQIKLNITRPAGNHEKLPVFLFVHGGGWAIGDYPTYQRLVRDLVVLSGCAAVFVNYGLSPEAIYPRAVNEVYAATKWVAENGSDIGVDGSKMAIVGNSSGGNLATVTALLAREKTGPEIKLQILLWPIVKAKLNIDLSQRFATGRYLTGSLVKAMFESYAPNKKQRKDLYISPLNAKIGQLHGLPPALIILAQSDISRDSAQAYARKLARAGVPVTAVRYNGMIHDFALLNALAQLPETQSALIQVAATLKKYLKPV